MKSSMEDLLKVCGVNFAAITVSVSNTKEVLQIISLFVAIVYTLIKTYRLLKDNKTKKPNDTSGNDE